MGCGCNAGMGDADSGERRFPRVEKVIAKYIRDELRAGRHFYISDMLNSEALRGVDPDDILAMFDGHPDTTLGFLAFLLPIFTSIVGAASTVGSAVVAAAPSIASVAGSVAAIKSINAANKGVVVPNTLVQPAAQAAQQDLLSGTGLTPSALMILAGGALLLALTSRRR